MKTGPHKLHDLVCLYTHTHTIITFFQKEPCYKHTLINKKVNKSGQP